MLDWFCTYNLFLKYDLNIDLVGILTREKPQEIKTVRIVKRESERRQRDRDRSGNIGIPISCGNKRNVLEESDTDADVRNLIFNFKYLFIAL